MSGGSVCKCKESKRPKSECEWEVTQRRCNHSAFSGYQHTRSDYSAIRCKVCHAVWRTKASYVALLPDMGKTRKERTI
jgi:hypothetical protein